jgi:hypothetical protein
MASGALIAMGPETVAMPAGPAGYDDYGQPGLRLHTHRTPAPEPAGD